MRRLVWMGLLASGCGSSNVQRLSDAAVVFQALSMTSSGFGASFASNAPYQSSEESYKDIERPCPEGGYVYSSGDSSSHRTIGSDPEGSRDEVRAQSRNTDVLDRCRVIAFSDGNQIQVEFEGKTRSRSSLHWDRGAVEVQSRMSGSVQFTGDLSGTCSFRYGSEYEYFEDQGPRARDREPTGKFCGFDIVEVYEEVFGRDIFRDNGGQDSGSTGDTGGSGDTGGPGDTGGGWDSGGGWW